MEGEFKLLIMEKNPKSIQAEAFRTLRTNIQYTSFDEKMKMLLVTSATPGEGKTTTAANLALSIAETDSPVLLLDCDLRRPSLHKKFNISNELGITDFLLGKASFEQTVKIYKNKLFIMTAGTIPPNPSEMLSSNKLKNFLNEVSQQFQMIIIDSPPVIPFTDAQILSTLADGVILVVASGETEKVMALKSKELLVKVNAKILGVVLNKFKETKGKGYDYGYGYYKEYYEDEKDGEKLGKKSKTRARKRSSGV